MPLTSPGSAACAQFPKAGRQGIFWAGGSLGVFWEMFSQVLGVGGIGEFEEPTNCI